MRKRIARVLFKDQEAGLLEELEAGYRFTYAQSYLAQENPWPVSLSLPLQNKPFETRALPGAFDGLIPEGWLLEVAVRNWKIDPRDRMQLLLATCTDCIGALRIEDASIDID